MFARRVAQLQGELRGDDALAVRLHERTEASEIDLRLYQPETQRSTHEEIVLQLVPQGAHAAPPGHGMASVRRRVRSTLA